MTHLIILDNEAVQALADPAHRKHHQALAYAQVVAIRKRRAAKDRSPRKRIGVDIAAHYRDESRFSMIICAASPYLCWTRQFSPTAFSREHSVWALSRLSALMRTRFQIGAALTPTVVRMRTGS